MTGESHLFILHWRWINTQTKAPFFSKLGNNRIYMTVRYGWLGFHTFRGKKIFCKLGKQRNTVDCKLCREWVGWRNPAPPKWRGKTFFWRYVENSERTLLFRLILMLAFSSRIRDSARPLSFFVWFSKGHGISKLSFFPLFSNACKKFVQLQRTWKWATIFPNAQKYLY